MTGGGRTAARLAALLGLAVMSAWIVGSPPVGPATAAVTRVVSGLIFASPLLVLLVSGLQARRKWGAWVAIVMIPYFAASVGALLVSPGSPLEGRLFSALIVAVFFAGVAVSRGR